MLSNGTGAAGLQDCTIHPPYRDVLGIVHPCPPDCGYWQARRDWIALNALVAPAKRPGARIVCQNTAPVAAVPPAPAVSRMYLAPLLSHKTTARALELFAQGTIDALELQKRLTEVAKVTGTTSGIVADFVTKAICAKFGLAMPEAAAEAVAQ